jgi:hypothetical protein
MEPWLMAFFTNLIGFIFMAFAKLSMKVRKAHSWLYAEVSRSDQTFIRWVCPDLHKEAARSANLWNLVSKLSNLFCRKLARAHQLFSPLQCEVTGEQRTLCYRAGSERLDQWESIVLVADES